MYCRTGGPPDILKDASFLAWIDLPRTEEDFGPPTTLESRVWVSCPSCKDDRVVRLYSAHAVWMKRSNGLPWEYLCVGCANGDSMTATNEDVSSYLEGHPVHSVVGRVYVQCEECESTIDTSLRALKNAIRAARKDGEEHSVVCHICSSSGGHYVSLKECEDAGFYLREETVSRFGHVPKYRSDQVVCRCSMCHGVYELKYDSLLRQAWQRRKEGAAFTYYCQLCSMKQEHVRSKLAASKARQHESGFRSSLEVATEDLLQSLGIEFIPQHPLGFYLFDFFLPQSKVLIECQGDYWHSLPKNQNNDASKAGYVRNHCPGYQILYLRESEFFNPVLVRSKIARTADMEDEPFQVDFDLDWLMVSRIEPVKSDRSWKSAPREFLDSYHYARHGRSAKAYYGVHLDGKLIGLAKFSSVVRTEAATSMGFMASVVMELDRFCIHPNFHKRNLASWFLSRASRLAFDDFPSVLILLTFSDPEFGHSGSIYKSANWTPLGETSASYFYVGQDGSALHKKTLYERARKSGFVEREYADFNGFVRRVTPPKLKFVLGRV